MSQRYADYIQSRNAGIPIPNAVPAAPHPTPATNPAAAVGPQPFYNPVHRYRYTGRNSGPAHPAASVYLPNRLPQHHPHRPQPLILYPVAYPFPQYVTPTHAMYTGPTPLYYGQTSAGIPVLGPGVPPGGIQYDYRPPGLQPSPRNGLDALPPKPNGIR